VIEVVLPEGHRWLRLVKPHYVDPFDTSYARDHGGRWNPPGSWPTLYVNEDLPAVHAHVRHLFVGRGIDPEDLDDDAPILLAGATLPRRQRVADVITDDGIEAVELPRTYSLDDDGVLVGHETTQPIGVLARASGLRGVWCKSAAGIGHELAWFPAAGQGARRAWDDPKPYGVWRHARSLDELDRDL
jgi:hypothetical protein